MTQREVDQLSYEIIGCAIEVHRYLGPGLHESADEQCLACERAVRGIGFQLQVPVPVEYQGVRRDCDYRIDILDQQPGRTPLVRDDAFPAVKPTL